MLKSAEGQKYYKTMDDFEADPRRPYSPPDVVALFQAAKYMNCTPWELARQSVYWQNVALTLSNVESEARAALARKNAPKR